MIRASAPEGQARDPRIESARKTSAPPFL